MQRPVTWRDMEEWKRKAALLDQIVELLNTAGGTSPDPVSKHIEPPDVK